eukprot:augustus_masked-scaffold_30-processed-gene-3.6-mRNA-1 protein AED:1.00 eAED:1.00 QI:0/0/0/0/1/1/2/0/335
MVSVIVYCDDLLIFTKSPDISEHMKLLHTVLRVLNEANARIKIQKVKDFREEITFLGMNLNGTGWSVAPKFVKVEEDAPIPKDRKALKSFLGLTSWQRSFIPNYGNLTACMQRLLKKDMTNVPFDKLWTEAHSRNFQELKKAIAGSAQIFHPQFNKPFFLACDASKFALGAVLFQLDYSGNKIPIEKEALGIVQGLQHFGPIIFGFDITVLTDQKPLLKVFLKKKPSKYIRYAELLHSYAAKLRHIKGNVIISDWASRYSLPVSVTEQGVKEIDNIEDWNEVTFENGRREIICLIQADSLQPHELLHKDQFYEAYCKAVDKSEQIRFFDSGVKYS